MEKIRCTVQRVLYCNRENGYTVFSAIPEDGYKSFVVQGTYYIVSAGAKLNVEGEWIEDKKYGHQFAATSWSEIVPETKEGIERFLAGGNITGIGPKTAKMSQGTEYPVVVIPMMSTAFIMLQRKLLYTAITRAKKLCIIVGTKQSIWQCVSNAYVQPRNTMLRERIIECFND